MPRRNNNRRARPRNARRRKPSKVSTARAPFAVSRNRQLLSLPDHPQGLTVSRKIRLQFFYSGSTTVATFKYSDIINRFLAEIALTQPAGSDITVNVRRVDCYLPSITSTSASTTVGTQLNLRIFNEPRWSPANSAFENNNFFESHDVASVIGIATSSCIIPDAAAYTFGTDDDPALLLLPFATATTNTPLNVVYLDVTATFTVKERSGVTFIVPHFSNLALEQPRPLSSAPLWSDEVEELQSEMTLN